MKEKIIIINRWDDELSRYEKYIDHERYDIAYLVNPAGLTVVDLNLAKGVEIVDDLYDANQVVAAAKRLKTNLNGVTKIIALSEFDLDIAAIVREQLAVKGAGIEQTSKFRDKVVMKKTVQEKGISAPHFIELSSHQAFNDFVKQYHYPVILKPKKGAASQGVVKLHNDSEAERALDKLVFSDYECEQYIAGDIYHVDGLINKGEFLFSMASRYINTCLDFNRGLPLGSVNVDDPHIKQSLMTFTGDVLNALGLSSGAFHLEIIQNKADGTFYFLEIGARIGGGEIPFITQTLHGINLIEAWIKIELEENLDYIQQNKNEAAIGGFLMIPAPEHLPCKVTQCLSLSEKIQALFWEKIPKIGHIFHGNGGYEDISGRFHFAASSSALVEQAILNTIEQFSMVTASVEAV